MRDFIARYLEVNQRAASPLYLYGESYGTTRSAVLAEAMVAAALPLDGIVLQSAVLDYNANCGLFDPGTAVSCAGYVPSYGMTGAWFGLVAPQPADSDAYAQQLRVFTDERYAPALAAYRGRAAPPDATLLGELVARTGAPLALWTQRFNLDPTSYREATLPAQLMGRYDARIAVPKTSPLAAGGDPSSSVITAPFAAAQRDHLANELGYSAGSRYTMLANAIETWDFHHDGLELPDTIPDLAAALAQRPRLRVLALSGYHDLATPFRQTEIDLARLGNVATLATRTYSGGHMIYLDDASRVRLKADLAAFIGGR